MVAAKSERCVGYVPDAALAALIGSSLTAGTCLEIRTDSDFSTGRRQLLHYLLDTTTCAASRPQQSIELLRRGRP